MELTHAVREVIGSVLSPSARAAATQLARGTRLTSTDYDVTRTDFHIPRA